ncbi:MAG: AMP-binding protein [Pseudomonadota bacterium]
MSEANARAATYTVRDQVKPVPEPGNEPWRRSLFSALCKARKDFGGSTIAVTDFMQTEITFDRLVLGSLILGEKIRNLGDTSKPIGVMMPNASAVSAVFFACQAVGRVPAMLNYSSGLRSLKAACETAQLSVILSSKAFIEKAGLHDLVEGLSDRCTFIWLEDVRASISVVDKIKGMVKSKLMLGAADGYAIDPDATAVILFTSGTEGLPKGVALTHANILANCWQFNELFDLTPGTRLFMALPVFHAFGLTVGLVATVILGVGVYFYPSPLHYKEIPEHIRTSGAKLVIATDTFLNGWMRSAKADDFADVELMVLGAERVREQTRSAFKANYGKDIVEGYGVTEAAPVLAANHPLDNVEGSVGRFLPLIDHRIEPVSGLNEGGRLLIKGPNVMAGYIRQDKPGIVQPPEDGWYDTGDIVDLDDGGRITIKGRAKRFAKLGGEMVSLSAVEAYVSQVWPDDNHAVISLPDARKGEMLVLVTERENAELQEVRDWAKKNGISELMLPKKAISIAQMPVLGTGKLNYGALNEIAAEAQTDKAA